jgi:hypothetical protein
LVGGGETGLGANSICFPPLHLQHKDLSLSSLPPWLTYYTPSQSKCGIGRKLPPEVPTPCREQLIEMRKLCQLPITSSAPGTQLYSSPKFTQYHPTLKPNPIVLFPTKLAQELPSIQTHPTLHSRCKCPMFCDPLPLLSTVM